MSPFVFPSQAFNTCTCTSAGSWHGRDCAGRRREPRRSFLGMEDPARQASGARDQGLLVRKGADNQHTLYTRCHEALLSRRHIRTGTSTLTSSSSSRTSVSVTPLRPGPAPPSTAPRACRSARPSSRTSPGCPRPWAPSSTQTPSSRRCQSPTASRPSRSSKRCSSTTWTATAMSVTTTSRRGSCSGGRG